MLAAVGSDIFRRHGRPRRGARGRRLALTACPATHAPAGTSPDAPPREDTREIRRTLKRYITRELYRDLTATMTLDNT
jgi:hypothetical protein